MIDEQAEILVSVDAVTNDMSNSGSGAIDISITGGAGGSYTVNWMLDGSMVGAGTSIANLFAGSYFAVITDANGCMMTSNEITVDNVLSLDRKALENMLRLFPNPASDHIHIQMNFDEAYEVVSTLYDVNGKELINSKPSIITSRNLEWDLSDYPQGIYFVKIRVEDKVITKRVVVQ